MINFAETCRHVTELSCEGMNVVCAKVSGLEATTTTQTKNKVKGGLLLNVVICEGTSIF